MQFFILKHKNQALVTFVKIYVIMTSLEHLSVMIWSKGSKPFPPKVQLPKCWKHYVILVIFFYPHPHSLLIAFYFLPPPLKFLLFKSILYCPFYHLGRNIWMCVGSNVLSVYQSLKQLSSLFSHKINFHVELLTLHVALSHLY